MPSANNYEYMGENANKTKHIWYDKATPFVTVQSYEEFPFGKINTVFFAIEKGRNRKDRHKGGEKYLKRLILKISEPDNTLDKAILTREAAKAHFAYNNDNTIAFAAFYTDIQHYWVYYKLWDYNEWKNQIGKR